MDIFTLLFAQAINNLPEQEAMTMTEQYAAWFDGHPVLVLLGTLVAVSVTAKAIPHIVGAVIGTITNTTVNIAKQTALAAVKPFQTATTTSSTPAPEWLRYKPEVDDMWGRGMDTPDALYLSISNIDETNGNIYYGYTNGETHAKSPAAFNQFLHANGYVHLN